MKTAQQHRQHLRFKSSSLNISLDQFSSSQSTNIYCIVRCLSCLWIYYWCHHRLVVATLEVVKVQVQVRLQVSDVKVKVNLYGKSFASHVTWGKYYNCVLCLLYLGPIILSKVSRITHRTTNLWSPDSQRKRHFYCHITIVTSNGQHEKPMVSPLTAEGLIAPMDNYTLLSAVPGVGSKYGAVTAPLCNTATNLWQTETEVGLPLHHVMTHLQNQKDRSVRGRRPR